MPEHLYTCTSTYKKNLNTRFTPFTKLNSKFTIILYIKYSTLKLLDDLVGWDGRVGGRLKKEGIHVYIQLIHWKRPWYWERLRAGGEGCDRGWDGWMASSTQWTWVWVNSRRWWWTGMPGMLQSMGSQRVRQYWATELNWKEFPTIPTPGWLLTFFSP